MIDRKRLVKLVRNHIGAHVDKDVVVSYEPMPGRDLIPAMRAKLVEEVGEYLTNPSIGELADVLEIVRALALDDLGITWLALLQEAERKNAERGDFSAGVGMFVTLKP